MEPIKYSVASAPWNPLRSWIDVYKRQVLKCQECQCRFKEAQKLMNEAKTEVNQVMKITIDDWRANHCRLDLPFVSGEMDD